MIHPYRGLGHQDHPWLNQVVADTEHGVTGRLMAVCPEPLAATPRRFGSPLADGPPVAWLRPAEGGGREWTTPLDCITRAGNPAPPPG